MSLMFIKNKIFLILAWHSMAGDYILTEKYFGLF